MLGNRGFRSAFLLSVLLHGIAFSGLGPAAVSYRRIKPDSEINYYENKNFPSARIEKLPLPLSGKDFSPPEVIAAAKVSRGEETRILAKKSISTKDGRTAGREYYEIVRERIRNSVNYPSPAAEGDVFLSFVLARDGALENKPQILDKESNSQAALRRAALRGIIDASPFPAFPDEISQSRLTFNIVISFRLNE